jgi:hypothetical protein
MCTPLDAERLHETRPLAARLWHWRVRGRMLGVARQQQQRLLDEPANEARIGAAARDGGGAGGAHVLLLIAHTLSQRIVGAVGVGNGGVKVKSGPRFDNSVDVERAERTTETHERE